MGLTVARAVGGAGAIEWVAPRGEERCGRVRPTVCCTSTGPYVGIIPDAELAYAARTGVLGMQPDRAINIFWQLFLAWLRRNGHDEEAARWEAHHARVLGFVGRRRRRGEHAPS